MLSFLFAQPWPWWFGGIALGGFVVLYTWVYSRLLGMSSTVEYAVAELKQPLISEARPVLSMEEAVLAMAREQGIDPATLGITIPAAPTDDTPAKKPLEFHPRMMVVGVLLGGLIAWVLSGAAEGQIGMGPEFAKLFPYGLAVQLGVLLVGGFFIGFGARMAGGCPSGHALGGLSVLSPASFTAIAGYFISGITLTYLLRWVAQ